MRQHQDQSEGDEGDDQLPKASRERIFKEVFDVASRESSSESAHVDNVLSQIEGDGIGADPDEGHRPFLPPPDFNGLIKGREQQGAVSARYQHVR